MKAVIRTIVALMMISVSFSAVADEQVVSSVEKADSLARKKRHTVVIGSDDEVNPPVAEPMNRSIFASDKKRLGSLLNSKEDSIRKPKKRNLLKYLIIPKKEVQVGVQLTYASLSSNDSEIALLLKDFDASGSILKIAPYVAYAYRDNRSIGLKFQYTSASGNLANADLSLLSDDLSFNIKDMKASLNAYAIGLYHRSYIGLDRRGRFGVFCDVLFTYTRSHSKFIYDESTENSYANGNNYKLSLHPGVVVFAMNNVSTHVSVGIGSVEYNQTKYFKDGYQAGTRNFSQAKFKLNILDVSFGLTIHL